jgi:tRNA threonylcarbamoyladenosine biosynthesis protein TsaB
MILVLRTDDKVVQCMLYEAENRLAEKAWEAGRELSNQLLGVIEDMIAQNGSSLEAIQGCIYYAGPGSYTGLRIGVSVVNALGYSYVIPVVATSGDNWIEDGLKKLEKTHSFTPITPNYGGNARVTEPKK